MREATLTLTNRVGLHARPAAVFVRTAKQYRSAIKVCVGTHEADAKSILSVLSLAANHGTQITLRATGDDEAGAVEELQKLVLSNFGEANGGTT